MPGRPGTAATSATPAAARARARRLPGSAGSSPPHPIPQAEQLTLDTPVPPARVLPRQLLHQRPHPVRDRRSSHVVRVGPLAPDQAPVPGQQGARSHDPVQPQVSRQQPCQGGDHGTVSPVRLRRAACRRKTATSCRSTRISASFAASLRAKSTSQPNTRTMKM